MITKEMIKEETHPVTYKKGVELYREGGVWEFTLHRSGNYDDIEAMVKGSGKKIYQVMISIDKENDYMEDCTCECPAFFNFDGICKHCVAALLEYEHDYIHQNEAADYANRQRESLAALMKMQKGMQRHTTPSMKKLLSQRGMQRSLPYIQKENWGQVRLEPHLYVRGDGINVEFKIGITQMYVLKDVFSFVEHVQNKEHYSYGKKLAFTHALGMFEAQSQPLVSFLEMWEYEHRGDYMQPSYYYYGYNYRPPKLREIPLDSSSLELFLDAVGKNEFYCDAGEAGIKYYHVEDTMPQFTVTICGVAEGLTLQPDMRLGYQCRNEYISFQNGCVYRIPREKFDPIEDFLQCIEKAPGEEIYIAQEDIPAFCANLLPELKKAFQCEILDFDEQEYAQEQGEYKIYLDMENQELLTLKGVAVYGGQEYLLYDDKTDMEKRDFQKEMEIRSVISQYANAFDYERKIMVLSKDEELLYELLTEGIERMKETAEVFVSESLKRLHVVSAPKVTAGVSLSGGLLQLKLTADEMSKEELIGILSQYNRKKKFYRLKNGDFVQTQDSGLDTLLELKEGMQLTEKQLKQEVLELPVYRALFMDEQLKGSKSLQTVRDAGFRSLIKNMKTVEDSEFEIPKSLEHILREYQKTGFLWIKTLKHNGFGGILADDMGLGKTLQVIAFLLSEYQEKQEKCTLIVTPASLVYNWKSEFERFAPALTVETVAGTLAERKHIIQEVSGSTILITSYDLLKRDLELYQEFTFACQVIDEAQYIKNHGTQAAKAVKEIQAEFRLALTGTPIENRLSELWSIFDYLMPGFLFSAKKFREEFENKIIKNQDEQAMVRLQKMTAPFILRRLKGLVLRDLPDKIEENRCVPLQGEQQKLYDAHVKRLQMMLEDKSDADFQTSKIQILAELTKIRQICCDPGLIFEGYKGGSVKLELCIQMIQNAVESGHKVLLFSQFTSMLERIQEQLEKEHIRFYSLTGAVSKEKRRQLVDNFQKDETSVFCISLKAGGTGLNLTAADIVIHYDPWWNVAAQNQATDRAHRIGQKHMVNVYKLIAKGTIEENIMKLQEKKQDLADQILSGSNSGTASFSREELLELLQG